MVDSISQIASAFESAKAITLEAAAVASSRLGESSYTHYSKNLSTQQLRDLLNSRKSREVKDAMKRVLSLLASGDTSINVGEYFSDIVKNISSDDIKIKRMVYIYLLRYAEKDPNLALLSVNAIQKTLTASDPEIRAFSLKALSDIKIPSLTPIILLSARKLIVDPSPAVRCEVAYTLMKLYRWERETVSEDVNQLFNDLLSDSDPKVISACLVVFKECFPKRLELLHGHYRYFCLNLKRLDPWAQSYLIEIMIRYSKRYIIRPNVVDIASTDPENNHIALPDKYNHIIYPTYELRMDKDLELFINTLKVLRFSPNPLVILSCCNAFFQLTTPNDFRNSRFPEVLINIAMATDNIGAKVLLLKSILLYSKLDNTLFLQFNREFLPFPSDIVPIVTLKLNILSTLINDTNVEFILRELKKIIKHQENEEIIIAASQTMASCGRLSTALESHIMKWLIRLIEQQRNKLSNQILDVFVNIIRELVSSNPRRHLKFILKLADLLTTHHVIADNARAGIIWLFGEIAGIEFKICPDVVRNLIDGFVDEGSESRRQIILLSAKLASYEYDLNKENSNDDYNIEDSRVMKMFKYLAYLGKFDDNYGVRDMVRYLTSIFDSGKYEIASLLLQAPKPNVWESHNGNINEEILSEDMENIDSDLMAYHSYIPWEVSVDTETSEAIDMREPLPIKDYNKFKKSFSSESYIDKTDTFVSGTSRKNSQSVELHSPTVSKNSFTSNTGKKYKLQSLDEFFSDVPASTTSQKYTSMPRKKKVVTVVETSSEEETDAGSEDDEDDRDDSDEESEDEESSGLSDSSN